MTTLFDMVPKEVLYRLPSRVLLHMVQIVDSSRLPHFAAVALQNDDPLLGFLVLERTIGREVSKTSITRELGKQDRGTVPSKMAGLVYSHLGLGTAEDAAAVYKWAWWPEETQPPTVAQLERCMQWFCSDPPEDWKQLLEDPTRCSALRNWRVQCVSNWGANMIGEWRTCTEMRVLAIVFGGEGAVTTLAKVDPWCSCDVQLTEMLEQRILKLDNEQLLAMLNATPEVTECMLVTNSIEYGAALEKSLMMVEAV